MAHSEQAIKFNSYPQKEMSFENTETREALSTSGIGFRFVRYFLLTILCVVGSMVAFICLLGWHLGMEITVAGQGRLQPTARYEVKAQRSGLIQTVHVQHGQEIAQGDLMLTLDDTDLCTELEKLEHELTINQSRRVALVAELQRERAVLETEIARAEVEYETSKLQLEQVRQEYQIYRKYAPYREDGSMRPPVDTLIPIRVHQTRVEGAKVEIERVKRRLAALDNRKQELGTLEQMYKKLRVSHRLIKTRMEQMKIYAPVSGTVLTRDLDKREGDRIEAGEAVIELAELHSWQAEVMIQEVDIPKVKEGHKVRIYVNAFPHMEYKIFEGRVTDVPRKPEPVTPMGAGLVPGGMSAVYPVKINVIDPLLLYINWKLALISLAVLPFDTVLVMISKKYLSRVSKKLTEASAESSATSYESLSGIRTVQALGLEAAFYHKIRDIFIDVSKLRIRSTHLSGGFGFIGSLVKTAGTLAYGWYGWTQVLNGNLSLGSYMAFSGYVGYLYGPIGNLIGLVGQVEMALVRINRFFEVYDLSPEIQDRPDMPTLPQVRGEIEFHDVSFSYQDDQPVLRGINLHVPAQATIALVGKSGSGKSTLAKLIPRFYDPQEGYVSIDGYDIRNYRLKSIRQQVGFAMQGSTLFQGSILDNLTFGHDIPLRDVQDATQAAYIHDFIASLPEGYETLVGEQGAQMSEGQKQRIALSRVLLMDTPILILDEPTAALDMESEYHIQEALKTVRQGRTTIIIAHRLSTIQNADEIVVLDAGQIAEQGTHEWLAMQDGVYAHLYNKMASI